MNLETALAVLGSDYAADDVENAALAAVCVAAGLALLAWTVASMAVAAGVLAVGAAAAYACYRAPILLATARRSSALGDGPALVCRAVLAMRLAPTLERAASFACEHGDGPLAASLQAHARRARAAPGTGWETFADEWGERDPDLRRAVSLLVAAATGPDADRPAVLDRALEAALDGTRDRLHDFATGLAGPTNAIYGFGVVLPLALVGALPAAAAAGVPISVPAVVAVFDLALPLGLAWAGAWLVARRPAAFPPTAVPASHPTVHESDRGLLAAAAAIAGLVVGFLATPVIAPSWTRWLVAPGLAAGGALLAWTRPAVAVRERVRAVEADLPAAVELVGRRLRDGEPLEVALDAVGAELGGPTGDLFADAAGVQSRLSVPPREALLGAHAPTATLPSARVESELALLPLAARAGPRGGDVLVTAAGHLRDLRDLEADARRSLGRTTDTLHHTAAVFGPLVGGTTVAMATRLGRGGADTGLSGFAAEPLGLAVGGYVLLLAVVLPTLATALSRGPDRALIGRRVGTALTSASVLFPVTLVGVGAVL